MKTIYLHPKWQRKRLEILARDGIPFPGSVVLSLLFKYRLIVLRLMIAFPSEI
jgi:hypothetical protein